MNPRALATIVEVLPALRRLELNTQREIVPNYLVRVPTMWRQAPIMATIVVASGLMDDSNVYGLYRGLSRVGQVLLGCVFGLAVTFVMSKVWPPPQAENGSQRVAPS